MTDDVKFAVPSLPIAKPPQTATVVVEPENNQHQKAPKLNYDKPEWSKEPSAEYYFEVLKQGAIVEKTDVIDTEFIVVGRIPKCDISMEHPSISRLHCVIQFRGDAAFVYDLGSSHGTYLNKTKLEPRTFHNLKVGDMLKFGESSRLYILCGPPEPEPIAKPIQIVTQDEMILARQKTKAINPSEDATWGMTDDTPREMDFGAVSNHEIDENAYYRKDPKKSLKNWLAQRGIDQLEFLYQEEGKSHERVYTAKISIPVDGGVDELEGIGSGSRRTESERNACLDALIKLDSSGILKGDKNISKERKKMKELLSSRENDDDYYYDRASSNKTKKQKIEENKPRVENLSSLKTKRENILNEINALEKKVVHLKQNITKNRSLLNGDELDDYVKDLEIKSDEKELEEVGRKLDELREGELQKLDGLIKLVDPVFLFDCVEEKKDEDTKEVESVTSTKNTQEVPPSLPPTFKKPEPIISSPTFRKSESSPSTNKDEPLPPNTVEEPSSPLEVNRKEGNKRKRMQRKPMTKEESEAQLSMEIDVRDTNDDWIPPEDRRTEKEIKSLNSAYGY